VNADILRGLAEECRCGHLHRLAQGPPTSSRSIRPLSAGTTLVSVNSGYTCRSPSERARSKRLLGVRPAQRLGVGAEVVGPNLDRCRCIVVSRWVPQLGGPCIGMVRGPMSRTVPAGPATASLASHCGMTTSWDGSHVVAEAVIMCGAVSLTLAAEGGCWARASIVDLSTFCKPLGGQIHFFDVHVLDLRAERFTVTYRSRRPHLSAQQKRRILMSTPECPPNNICFYVEPDFAPRRVLPGAGGFMYKSSVSGQVISKQF
jgi:hypothetical protein